MRRRLARDPRQAASAPQPQALRAGRRVLSRCRHRSGSPHARRRLAAGAPRGPASGVQGRRRDREDVRAVPGRRPGVRTHEPPRARGLLRARPLGRAARPSRRGARGAGAGRGRRREPALPSRRRRVRGPRAQTAPRAAEARRGREPGAPRPKGRLRPAAQARLLHRLASRGSAQAPAPRPRRLAARHERQRSAEADRGRRPAPGPRRDRPAPVPCRPLRRRGRGRWAAG